MTVRSEAGAVFNRTESGAATGSIGGVKGEMELKGLNVQVVGLGLTGISASRFLAGRGARVTATDLRPATEIAGAAELEGLGVKVFAGGRDIRAVRGIDLVVVSPGVVPDIPLLKEARDNGIEIISDIELAFGFMREPILAVTGTNGKTTTTSLLGKLLSEAGKDVFVGGNIGTPVLDVVEGASGGGPDFSVLEVSSFQLEGIKDFRPHLAILLNITEDHLYRYKDFDDYAQTKFRLFMNQGSDDYAILNMDDPSIRGALEREGLRAKIIELRPLAGKIGEGADGLYLDGDEIIFRLGSLVESYPTSGFGLITEGSRGGRNSVENIMAAIASARLTGVERDVVIESINSFKGLSHRIEFVREFDGVAYINDSKATNPASVVRALESLAAPVVLVAGGVNKGSDFALMEEAVREKVKLVVLFGEAGKEINKALSGVSDSVIVGSFDEAVGIAHRRAKPGDTVILSPACSSFDEFKSFAARGDRFKKLVGAF